MHRCHILTNMGLESVLYRPCLLVCQIYNSAPQKRNSFGVPWLWRGVGKEGGAGGPGFEGWVWPFCLFVSTVLLFISSFLFWVTFADCVID